MEKHLEIAMGLRIWAAGVAKKIEMGLGFRVQILRFLLINNKQVE